MIGQILGLGALEIPQPKKPAILHYVDDLIEALDRLGEITFVTAKGIAHHRHVENRELIEVHSSLAMLGIIHGKEEEGDEDGYDHVFKSGIIQQGPAFEAVREFRRQDIAKHEEKQRQQKEKELGEAMDDEFLGGSP